MWPWSTNQVQLVDGWFLPQNHLLVGPIVVIGFCIIHALHAELKMA